MFLPGIITLSSLVSCDFMRRSVERDSVDTVNLTFRVLLFIYSGIRDVGRMSIIKSIALAGMLFEKMY